MMLRRCTAGLLVGVMALTGLAVGCRKPPAQAAVWLEKMEVPRGVFSFSGEVSAFRAAGEAGRKEKVKLPLDSLRARFDKFDRALVYEFDAAGKRLSQQVLTLSGDASATIEATAGNTYLAYADLGARYQNGYRLKCNLSRLGGRGERLPEICTQILCGNQQLAVSELATRFPVLRELGALTGLEGDGPVGGFGLDGGRPVGPGGGLPVGPVGTGRAGGAVCDSCLNTGGATFVPVVECSGELPVTRRPPGEAFVYEHIAYTTDTDRGPTQIFKMNADGSAVNLSNNNNTEQKPDVSPDGREIAYVRDGRLHVMGINGENPTQITDMDDVSRPRWLTLDRDVFIFFIRNGEEVYRINRSGTTPTLVTSPGGRLSDVHADRFTGKDLVIERSDANAAFDVDEVGRDVFGSGFFNSDLFAKDAFDDDPVVRLTDTPDLIESLPTGANRTESLIAYSVLDPRNKSCQVQVATIDFDLRLTVLRTITIREGTDWGISGISFSADDSRLLVSTRSSTLFGMTDARKYEIYSVNVDGTDLQRLTFNTDLDDYPSAVPAPR